MPFQQGSDLVRGRNRAHRKLEYAKGNFERENSAVYMAEAPHGEKPGIDCTQPHLPNDVQVISGSPHPDKAGTQSGPWKLFAIRRPFPEGPCDIRTLGRQCRHFYDNLACAARSGCETEKKMAKKQSHLKDKAGSTKQKARSKGGEKG